MRPETEARFAEFDGRVSLGTTQHGRIQSAVDALTAYLRSALGLASSQIFVQGSYANGTAVKPAPSAENGEYDVDLVLVCASASDTPKQAKDRIRNAMLAHGTYKDRIEALPEGKPCVRLRYADDEIGGFHVDLVPARPSVGPAPLEVPKGDGWSGTAPREYVAWCDSLGEGFKRTVRAIKRWRDEQQDERRGIKSIVLQVLAGKHLARSGSDEERLAATLAAVAAFVAPFETAPEVRNPSLPSENLTKSWPIESFRDFKANVQDAAEIAASAVSEVDPMAAAELWSSILGDSFPNDNPLTLAQAEAVRELGNTSHKEPLIWPEEPRPIPVSLSGQVATKVTKSTYSARPPYSRSRTI